MTAVFLIASLIFGSNEIGNFIKFDWDNPDSTYSINTDDTFGSGDHIVRRFYAIENIYATAVPFEAYYERALYSSCGPRNDWSVSEYGPNESPSRVDFRYGFNGSFIYRSSNTNDPSLFYFPNTRRFVDTENIRNLLTSGGINNITCGNTALLDRGSSWRTSYSAREIYWSSTYIEELRDRFYHDDLSMAFLPMSNFANTGNGTMLHRREGNPFSLSARLVGDAWIKGTPPVTVPHTNAFDETFEEMLTRYTANGTGNYVYPGMTGYVWTTRLVQDEFKNHADSTNVMVSPVAAANRVLHLADVTFEPMVKKPYTTLGRNISISADDQYVYKKGTLNTALPVQIEWTGFWGDEYKLYVTASGLDFEVRNTHTVGGAQLKISDKYVSSDTGRIRYRFSGVQHSGGISSDVSITGGGTYTHYHTYDLDAIPNLFDYQVNNGNDVASFFLHGTTELFLGAYEIQIYSLDNEEDFLLDAVLVEDLLDDLYVEEIDFDVQSSGLSKSCEHFYTYQAPGASTVNSMYNYAGPGSWAFDHSIVLNSDIHSFYNIAGVRAIDTAYSRGWGPSTKVEDISLEQGDKILAALISTWSNEQSNYAEPYGYINPITSFLEQVHEETISIGNSISNTEAGSHDCTHLMFDGSEISNAKIRNIAELNLSVTGLAGSDLEFYRKIGDDGYVYGPLYSDPECTKKIKEIVFTYGISVPWVSASEAGIVYDEPKVIDITAEQMSKHPPTAVDAGFSHLIETQWSFKSL